MNNDESDPESDNDDAAANRGRGRPIVPLQWSRVISISLDKIDDVRTFDLATDLIVDNARDKNTFP